VKVFDAAGKELSSFAAAPQGQDGTTIAVGDVTGDGRADIVTGSGGVVRVFDTRGVEVYPSFTPYASYDGPVSVAVGDANHDGRADVITAGANGPEVQIFSTLGTSAQSFAEFDAFDATSSGPLSLAAADTNGNGAAEILAGVQPGYGGEVRLLYGFRDCTDQPDGWHIYDSLHPESYLPPYQFGVSPGFDKAVAMPFGLSPTPRDPARWRQDVEDLNASPLPWHLVLTFNEWGEGTAIESAQEWATPSGYGAYLDALHNDP